MSRLSLPQGASPCAPAEGAIPHRIDFKFRSPSRPSSASTATMAAAVASVQLHGCVRSGRSSRNSGSAISAAPAPVRASRRAAAAAVTCSAQAERQSPLVIASQQPILPPRRVRGRAERSGGLWACRERAREAGGGWAAAVPPLTTPCCRSVHLPACSLTCVRVLADCALQDAGHGRRSLWPAAAATHRVLWRRGARCSWAGQPVRQDVLWWLCAAATDARSASRRRQHSLTACWPSLGTRRPHSAARLPCAAWTVLEQPRCCSDAHAAEQALKPGLPRPLRAHAGE